MYLTLVEIPTCNLGTLGGGVMSEAGDGHGVVGRFGEIFSSFAVFDCLA